MKNTDLEIGISGAYYIYYIVLMQIYVLALRDTHCMIAKTLLRGRGTSMHIFPYRVLSLASSYVCARMPNIEHNTGKADALIFFPKVDACFTF